MPTAANISKGCVQAEWCQAVIRLGESLAVISTEPITSLLANEGAAAQESSAHERESQRQALLDNQMHVACRIAAKACEHAPLVQILLARLSTQKLKAE